MSPVSRLRAIRAGSSVKIGADPVMRCPSARIEGAENGPWTLVRRES